MRSPQIPPNPACAACSKPIRSNTLALFEHGDWFHVRCRSQAVQLRSLEAVDRARIARDRASNVRANATQSLSATRHLRATPGACPLCGHPVKITDWHPNFDWLAIEDCRCDGFFIRGGLFKFVSVACPSGIGGNSPNVSASVAPWVKRLGVPRRTAP
jgi:hypothetical protein